jgi:hypothetical protein
VASESDRSTAIPPELLDFAAMLRTPATLRGRSSAPPIGRPSPQLRRSFSLPEPRAGEAVADPDARLARAARLGPRFPAPASATPMPVQRNGFEEELAEKPRTVRGPRSAQGRRARQVIRHISHLTLNRLSSAQRATGGADPTEVQMSLVGGSRLLMATNHPEATAALHSSLTSSTSSDSRTAPERLAGYLQEADPTRDKDPRRIERFQSKLGRALAGTRGWQQEGAEGEDAEDVARANAILEAFRQGPRDLLRHDDFGVERAADLQPGVHFVLPSAGAPENTHAERVQSDFRDAHLRGLDGLSTPPSGTKVPCLSCLVHHREHYPDLAPTSGEHGEYYAKHSPITSDEGRRIAQDAVSGDQWTSSVTRHNVFLDADEAESDSDEEDGVLDHRPIDYQLGPGETPPKSTPWSTPEGPQEFPNLVAPTGRPVRSKKEQRRAREEARAAKAGGAKEDPVERKEEISPRGGKQGKKQGKSKGRRGGQSPPIESKQTTSDSDSDNDGRRGRRRGGKKRDKKGK